MATTPIEKGVGMHITVEDTNAAHLLIVSSILGLMYVSSLHGLTGLSGLVGWLATRKDRGRGKPKQTGEEAIDYR